MLKEKLKNYHIILASASPRRHAFLKSMDLEFEVKIHPVKEVYPQHLQKTEITDFLAKLKAEAFTGNLKENEILITSDTIVWLEGQPVEKPKDKDDAFRMIKSLSAKTHEVLTSICISQTTGQQIVNTTTKVTFKALTDEEIWYYINNYNSLDKAGAYGVQDWIGAIAITKIDGSYNNVVGLPTHLLYETLINIADD
jgi:septum formation protein